MAFARRLSAAITALMLALFPLAMERCRTACLTPAVHTAQPLSAHACHEATSDDSGARMDPASRACGHSDEVGAKETAGLAAAKTRSLVLLPIVESFAYLHGAVGSTRTIWLSLGSDRPRPPLSLNSPLRL
jgi:hypothetical protein